MKYLHRQFTAKKRQKVVVNFDKPAKIFLLTDPEYKNYKDCKTFRYRGGFCENSPAEFEIPGNGKWHIVVELGSYFKPEKISAKVSIHSE